MLSVLRTKSVSEICMEPKYGKIKGKSVWSTQILPFAFSREVLTFFRAGLLFKRDSFPDNCIDWTNENVSFGARNYECLSKERSMFCSRVVQV